MRDKLGKIIYVGKASKLRQRVSSYFRRSNLNRASPKIQSLVESVASIEHIIVRTNEEASLLESKLIKDYKPKYNTAFTDDKRFLLLRINLEEPFPHFSLCRIKKNDNAEYFGPYTSSMAARTALDFVEKKYGIRKCKVLIPKESDHQHCINDIVRFCSAPCIGKTSKDEYLMKVKEACAFLRGERKDALKEIEQDMNNAAADKNFERAAVLRDVLLYLKKAIIEAQKSLPRPFKTSILQKGIAELKEKLMLPTLPKRIEAFDVSNIYGSYATASMVVALDGKPFSKDYRMFRIKTIHQVDDPAMIAEVITRRYRRLLDEHKNLPHLVLVDGGIAQLNAARRALNDLNLITLPVIGLAKKYEEIYYFDETNKIKILTLDKNTAALHILQRLRDEAHRFALSYHKKLRLKKIRESVLDEIDGVGETKKKILLDAFGSIDNIRQATLTELAKTKGIGKKLAQKIKAHLKP